MAGDRNGLPFDVPVGPIADEHDRVPIAANAPARMAAPIAAEPPQRPHEARCVVIGPSAAGKTSLLLALDRACTAVRRYEPDLRFVPEPSTARLMERAVDIMVNPDAQQEASRDQQRYEFTIQSGSDVLRAEIDDGPGGALFPTESVAHPTFEEHFRKWRGDMLARVAAADMLVLCINSDDSAQVTWETNLGRLIADAVVSTRLSVGWTRSGAWFRRKTVETRCLRARRVLLLLTQSDRVCDGMTTQYRIAAQAPGTSPSTLALAQLTPAKLANMIDPVAQVKRLLGRHALSLIHAALHPEAVLAVAACSAGGFAPNGEPYWTAEGKPREAAVQTRDEILRRWAPWGLRDAVYFLTTGRIRGNVRRLGRAELADDEPPPVKVAPAPSAVFQENDRS